MCVEEEKDLGWKRRGSDSTAAPSCRRRVGEGGMGRGQRGTPCHVLGRSLLKRGQSQATVSSVGFNARTGRNGTRGATGLACQAGGLDFFGSWASGDCLTLLQFQSAAQQQPSGKQPAARRFESGMARVGKRGEQMRRQDKDTQVAQRRNVRSEAEKAQCSRLEISKRCYRKQRFNCTW